MTLRRYSRTDVYGFYYGTNNNPALIRENIANGNIKYTEITLKQNDRLDILAGLYYGDSRLFWIIGASSGIGFGFQCPAGTIIRIPDINDVSRYLG